ncbi:protein of unknown function (plasmid) [Cupriavidus taiwanensis]|uniref:Uncharacterized protein n=1 Tax=Cupriavidus taiwanensis TaxID=164546 RepID=A0A375FDW0_9BURK|nr:protein of unknown function [Cupriavidus taiwanensis]SOZ72174.1 protein of unknown function [Cupriavidus taiwanensis]SOZ74471.1 protein of unknown function [Cupriavidus taiwanensis]SPA03385.1 protein of unknown function [Cupriavidus taiwanensis]SPA11390.1 protein of unknown function [Cupriavidus taiwanensis]
MRLANAKPFRPVGKHLVGHQRALSVAKGITSGAAAITASDESCRLGGTKKSAASRAFCSRYLRIYQRAPIRALSRPERAYSNAGDLQSDVGMDLAPLTRTAAR